MAERAQTERRNATAMDIKQGEVFKNSTDGVDFVVKKIVKDMVILETEDRRRQILTGLHTLTSTSLLFQKKGGEES